MPDKSEKESLRLKKAIDELVALNKISTAINALMSVEKITQVIVDNCLKKTNAEQGAIFLLEDKDKQIDKFKTFVRESTPAADKIPFHINESLSGWMIKNKTIFSCNNPDSDERFKRMSLESHGISSILSAPVLTRKGLIGTLILVNKKDPGGFTNEDKRFLGIVGTQVSQVVDNARLREKEEKLIEIEEEINIARTIQQGFLPQSGERLKRCEIFGFNSPAREVGGDYYDIVRLDENRIFFSLGDVSGKGIPASLLMANAQAVFRSQLFVPGELRLEVVAGSLNKLICQFSSSGQFITTIFGYYDCKERKAFYVNAGHMAPIIVRGKDVIIDPELPDIVLGVLKDHEYRVKEVDLEDGDLFFVYSDGITDLLNSNGDSFGETKLSEFLSNHGSDSVSMVCEKLYRRLQQFRDSAPQFDDITFVSLKVTP